MKEVSFYTTQNDAAVTVTIRKYSTTHPDTNIDSGTLIEQSKDIIIPLAGYHTYKLADPATLNKGEYFSVILDITNPSYEFPIATETRINGYSDYAVVYDRESYFYEDNKWVDGAYNKENNAPHPMNACIKAFTKVSDANVDDEPEQESPTIAGIPVEDEPDYTVDDQYVKNLNPDYETLSGRKFSQILADNSGKALTAGVQTEIILVDMTEYYEYTPEISADEKRGSLPSIPDELDPLFNAMYSPDLFIDTNGVLFPSYVASVVTSSDGSITIDADNLVNFNGGKVNIPESFYFVIYSADVSGESTIGNISVVEVTAAETPVNPDEDEDTNIYSGGGSSGCNSGTFAGLSIIAVIFALKSRNK